MAWLNPATAEALALSVSLTGLPADAGLQITLPADYARLSIGQLLDTIFPTDELSRVAVADGLDTAANPDLPDIYDCFLPVLEQYRAGLCQLRVKVGGLAAELSDPVSRYGQAVAAGTTELELSIAPEYRALDYAVAEGYAASQEELLAWLRECTLLYFLDKHEYRLPAFGDGEAATALGAVVERLCGQGLLNLSEESGFYEIAANGRRFIGRLLMETEGYIDRFDVFKDTLWEEDGGVEFASGHGEDLRAQLFIAEGLDPARTVFLLRLYDGTLDEFAADWVELMEDADFFQRLLEPVVNREQAPEEWLPAILEAGYADAEAQGAAERERRAQERIARQVRAIPEES